MSKKIIFSAAVALAMGFSLTSTTVFAEDGIMPINETSEATPTSDTDTATPTNETAGEISEPTSDVTSGDKIDLESGTNNSDDSTAKCGDGSIVDADGNIAKCEDEEESDDEEPEMWPMYVSLGALGAAILVFIILNLFGKRKH